MKDEEGNVQPDETPPQKEEIRPGDVVCLTPEAIKRAPRLMGPIKLYSIGWPNLFQVIHVFEADGLRHLTIGGCCYNLVINRRNNARLCTGHEAKWFRKVVAQEAPVKEAPRARKSGDRLVSIEAPIVGEMGAIEYLADDQNPAIVFRLLGQKIVLNGKAATDIAKIAQANGLL